MLKFHTTSFYKNILLKTFAAFRTESTFQIDSSSILRSFVRQNHSDLQQRNRGIFVVPKSRLKCYYWCQGQHHLFLLLWIGAILIYIFFSLAFFSFLESWTFMMMDSYWLHSNLYAEYAGTKHHFSHVYVRKYLHIRHVHSKSSSFIWTTSQ